MILVTRLDGSPFYVNADLIQSVEGRPDTHIVLVNGHSYIVREPAGAVIAAILEYRRSVSGEARVVPFAMQSQAG